MCAPAAKSGVLGQTKLGSLGHAPYVASAQLAGAFWARRASKLERASHKLKHMGALLSTSALYFVCSGPDDFIVFGR